MMIRPMFLAIRAVSAEFSQRIYVPIAVISGASVMVLLALSIWLVTISQWWWFLLGPTILVSLLALFVIVITGFLIRFLAPRQTKQQRSHVKHFVDALQYAAETAQTPKFVLLVRLVIDLIAPSKTGMVSELSRHATSLNKDFRAIITLFS